MVDGRLLVRDGQLTELSGLEAGEVVSTARAEAARILSAI
jgi:hypothetical protein